MKLNYRKEKTETVMLKYSVIYQSNISDDESHGATVQRGDAC
jgi:hypothetical protein